MSKFHIGQHVEVLRGSDRIVSSQARGSARHARCERPARPDHIEPKGKFNMTKSTHSTGHGHGSRRPGIPKPACPIVLGANLRADLRRQQIRLELMKDVALSAWRKRELERQISAINDLLGGPGRDWTA